MEPATTSWRWTRFVGEASNKSSRIRKRKNARKPRVHSRPNKLLNSKASSRIWRTDSRAIKRPVIRWTTGFKKVKSDNILTGLFCLQTRQTTWVNPPPRLGFTYETRGAREGLRPKTWGGVIPGKRKLSPFLIIYLKLLQKYITFYTILVYYNFCIFWCPATFCNF